MNKYRIEITFVSNDRIKVEFKKGYYMERQHVYNLDGNDIAGVDLSSILHDIDKFMFNNFKELV